MKRALLAVLIALASLSLLGADPNLDRYNAVGGKIMCTCGCGEMLLKCNHVGCPNSDTMIRQLRANLQTFPNDDDVLQWFRKEWGVTAVVEPSTHGFELLAWMLPIAGFLVGLGLLVFIVRQWRMRQPAVSAADAKLDSHLEALRLRARKETEI